MRGLVTLICALLIGGVACGGGTASLPAPLPSLVLNQDLARGARSAAETELLRSENHQRGWRCGYAEGWRDTLTDARERAPLRWRGGQTGALLAWGLIMLLVGLTVQLVAVLVIPRLQRARRVAEAQAAEEAENGSGVAAGEASDPKRGWLAFVEGFMTRTVGRLARVLGLSDDGGQTRVEALAAARSTERLLTEARGSLSRLRREPPLAGAHALDEALQAWLGRVSAVHAELGVRRLFTTRLRPERVRATLDTGQGRAQAVRQRLLALEYAAAPDESVLVALTDEVLSRPRLPEIVAAGTAALAPWVRPVGWGGAVGLVLAIPMTAAWTAAGAFPLFVALVLSLGALGATVTARVHLHQAGRLPLLPGLADRVARWLTVLVSITTVLMIVSSMATAESGLDLGDDPPVPEPGAAQLELPPAPALPALRIAPGGFGATAPGGETAPSPP